MMLSRSLSDFDEAKFESFNSMQFKRICFGLESAGKINWLELPIQGPSLLSLFKSGKYIPTRLGKAAWRSLIGDSTMQRNCNREGINVKAGEDAQSILRIGIAGNNENDCYTCDSAVGAGISPHMQYCTSKMGVISSGNMAGCGGDNGNKILPATSYVFIK